MDVQVASSLDSLALSLGVDGQTLRIAHGTIKSVGTFSGHRTLTDLEAFNVLYDIIHAEQNLALAEEIHTFDLSNLNGIGRSGEPRPFKDGLRRQWWDR